MGVGEGLVGPSAWHASRDRSAPGRVRLEALATHSRAGLAGFRAKLGVSALWISADSYQFGSLGQLQARTCGAGCTSACILRIGMRQLPHIFDTFRRRGSSTNVMPPSHRCWAEVSFKSHFPILCRQSKSDKALHGVQPNGPRGSLQDTSTHSSQSTHQQHDRRTQKKRGAAQRQRSPPDRQWPSHQFRAPPRSRSKTARSARGAYERGRDPRAGVCV